MTNRSQESVEYVSNANLTNKAIVESANLFKRWQK